MTDQESEKKGLYYKVECREDALKLVKDSTNIWYIITVINVGLYAMMGAPGYFYVFPVLWVLMATGVRFLYSRIAAVILFLLSLYSAYATFTYAAAQSAFGTLACPPAGQRWQGAALAEPRVDVDNSHHAGDA